MKLFLSLALACVLMLTGCKSGTDQHAVAAPAPVEATTCGSIKKISKVGQLYLAGQPSAEDYAQIKERGVKTVIDLRKDEEQRGFDEAKVVSEQGMTYVQIPWGSADELTDAKLDAMREALRTAERPLLMKCGSSNRVGAGWLAYRVLDEGVPVEQALAEAKEVGMRTPAYETKSLDYIKSRQK